MTLFRWVQRFTPLLVDAARPCRHAVSGRWFVDETYVKVAGVWRYVYRAVDEHGQVIDVYVSATPGYPRGAKVLHEGDQPRTARPDEVVTDLAQALETVIEELLPGAFHNTAQYANNGVECDHGRLKARLRPMRGLKTNRTRQCGHLRPRLHAEHTSRPLRTRGRGGSAPCGLPPHSPSSRKRSDRDAGQFATRAHHPIQQRNSAVQVGSRVYCWGRLAPMWSTMPIAPLSLSRPALRATRRQSRNDVGDVGCQFRWRASASIAARRV